MSTAPKSSVELLRWLWNGYLRQHSGLMALAMVFMLLEGGMIGAVSYMMQPMFDDVFVAGNTGALKWVSLTFLIIFCVRGLAGVVQKVLLAEVAQKTAAHLRVDLLMRLIRQDSSFHQNHPPRLSYPAGSGRCRRCKRSMARDHHGRRQRPHFPDISAWCGDQY